MFPVHSLAQRVLSLIRREELFRAGERVGVAVSGGIDSVALLRLLLELRSESGIVLSVVHFNHKLRGAESDADEAFVAGLARAHGVEFFSDSDDVAGHAAAEQVSVETAARELRYGFFRHLLEGSTSGAEAPFAIESADRAGSAAPPESAHLDKILTGHTLDDQAETVVMRMVRGAGLRGLGAIHPRIAVENDDGEVSGEIVRPLLSIRRCELEQYLKELGQVWREDSSNADDHFTRNRVRKLVMPLLEKEFNPAVAENLAELAEIARGEEDYWDNEVAGWMGTAVHWSEPEWAAAARREASLVQIAVSNPSAGGSADLRTQIENASWRVMNASVDLLWLLSEPAAVQRRLVKAVGQEAGLPLEFKHVEEILRFAGETASGKQLSLPLGWTVERDPESLQFITPDLRGKAESPGDYEYELPVPGRVNVDEIGSALVTRQVPAGDVAAYNPENLLDAESLSGSLRVRNWRPGDRFWPAHTKSPRKVKELLQERHLRPPERKLWPVAASGEELVWMRGFPLPAKFQAKPGSAAIAIVEEPLR